jgi:hypothetical protein
VCLKTYFGVSESATRGGQKLTTLLRPVFLAL